MCKSCRPLLSAIGLVASILFSCSVVGNIHFNHFDNTRGLPQINVMSIYQDETGAMWFGTINGLCRYNGGSTKVYHSSPVSTGLTQNNIVSITGNGDGAVYMRGEYDLVRYNIATEEFELLSTNVTGIFYGNGKLWYQSADKVYTWSEDDRKTTLYSETAGVRGSLTALCVSDKGDVWVGGDDGLAVIRASEGGLKTQIVLRGVNVCSLAIDSEGLVWVGTQKEGIYVLEADAVSKWHFEHNPGKNSISNNFVRTITEDESGAVWAGTFFGLNRFDKRTGLWTNYIHDDTQPHSLSHSSVFATYRDAQNTIWVGTYFGGVNYFNPRSDIFRYYSASSTMPDRLSFPFVGNMIEDDNGGLWICTEGGGLNRLDLETRKFTRYLQEHDLENAAGYNLKSICRDTLADKLYIGIHNVGLCVLDNKTGKSTILDRPDWAARAMQFHRGSIVALVGSGLCRIDTGTDTLVPFSDDDRLTELVNREYAYSFFIDSHDRLWISTVSDLLKRIDLNTGEEKYYLHDNTEPRSFGRFAVMSFAETADGEMFFGTHGAGLFRYNPSTDDFNNYTVAENGQISDFCYHISEMTDGNLIILHENALSVFDPRREAMIYCSTDNFPLSGFFEGSTSYVTRSGEIFIGGVNGLVSVDQTRLANSSPMDYKLYFDRLTVGSREIHPGDETGILPKILPFVDEITLRHYQNSLSIEFATSDYSLHIAGLGYEYRMEGVDSEWIVAPSRVITYANLAPGRYTLVVREADPDRPDELKKSRTLAITVRPPLYKTLFAKIVYALLAGGLVVGIILFFVWRYRMRTRLEMERREKENIEHLNRMKLGFFTSVSHEFRTPLTLIMAQIEHILSAGGLDPNQRLGISKVYDNSKHLRELISELLDFRKVEQGFYNLKIRCVDLVGFVGEICGSFTEYAAKHRIKFEYVRPQESSVEAYVDKAQLKKAIYNLLSNAFKYTSDGGEITVRLRVDDRIHILVEDNGIGISSEALSRIFERFYQVEYRTSGLSLGTGIGLALAKEIIESHRGEISVRSTLNEGSVFVISLQKGCSHFDAAELPVQPVTADKDDDQASQTAIAESAATAVEAASILIVDDNEQLLSLLLEIFSDEYTVYTAIDGRQGLEMAGEYLPDLILTDVMMPEMSGKEMCRRIKNDVRLSHIPVIMLTSFDSVDDTVEGYMFGADDYVAKPFNQDILKARCKAIIRTRRNLYHAVAARGESTAVEIRSEQDRLFMEKATGIVRANFDNPDFDMDMLASEMCMGRNKLYMSMKKISGMTPHEFTLATKLRESTELLKNHHHLNITDIADRLGFYSPKHFSKCFKTFYGVTPARWRKEEHAMAK